MKVLSDRGRGLVEQKLKAEQVPIFKIGSLDPFGSEGNGDRNSKLTEVEVVDAAVVL